MTSFFDLEFSLPDKYIFLTNKTMQEIVLEENRDKFQDYILEYLKAMIETGTMAIVCDPDKYDPLAMSLSEVIKLAITYEIPKPEANVSSENFLIEKKTGEEEVFLAAYGIPIEFIKYELSNIPLSVERSIYSEAKGLIENTSTFQYSFFVDKNYYTLTLDCFDKDIQQSSKRFNEIIKSIKV